MPPGGSLARAFGRPQLVQVLHRLVVLIALRVVAPLQGFQPANELMAVLSLELAPKLSPLCAQLLLDDGANFILVFIVACMGGDVRCAPDCW